MGRGVERGTWTAAATLAVTLLGGGAGANTWQSLGPWGGEVRALVSDGASWFEYAATWGAGVYRRVPGGGWEAVGSGVVHHRVNDVALAAVGSPRVFAATAAGLFASSDGGETWITVPLPGAEVTVVEADPTNPSVVWAGTAGGGVYKSADGGSTWQARNVGLTSLNLNLFINDIAISGAHPERLLVASEGGVFRSLDSGDSWVRLAIESGANQANRATAIAVDPSRAGTVYLGTDGELWVSSDFGASWTVTYADPAAGAINAIAVDGAAEGVVLAATSGRGVVRSQNWGAAWQSFDAGLAGRRVLALTRRTSDGTWLAGTAPGGVYQRGGGGSPWSADTVGIPNFNVRSVAAPAAGQGGVVVGTASGLFRHDGQGFARGAAPLGELDVTAVHGSDPMFVGTAGAGVFRCTSNGGSGPSCEAFNDGLPDLEIRCLAVDELHVWAATRSAGVFHRAQSGTGPWTAAGLAGESVNALLFDSPTWWAATDQGLRFTVDLGQSWGSVAGGLPDRRIVALAKDDSHLFASVAMGGVYRSADGGASWVRLSGGLASPLVMALAAAPEALYAGTVNAGVYRSSDAGESWNALNNGLLNPRVNALAVAADGSVFAGTDGSGVFALTESSACVLSCGALVPAAATAGTTVAFQAQVEATGCASAPVHTWSFDDGSAPVTGASVEHVFAHAGSYQWTLSAEADGVRCSTTGTIVISDPPPIFRSFVAAVAHAPGAGGTQWRTDLTLVNPTTTPAEVVLTFLPYGGGGVPVERRATVAVHGAVEWLDVLVSLFGFSAATAVKGSVEIVSTAALAITSRTYNQAAKGSFGQYYPAVAAGSGYGFGATVYIPQLKRNASFRSNVGALNVGDETASVEVRIFNSLGQQVGATVQRDIPAGRYWQWDDVLGPRFANTGEENSAYAVVKVLTAGGRVWSYGSVVDNSTGDPTTVPGLAGQAVEAFYVPSVAHAPGAAGTQWRTNLAVINPAAAPAQLTVTFSPYAGGGTLQERSLELGAGATVEWVDVLVTLFGMSPASSVKGSLRVAANGPLVLGSRTYNQTATGTFGQFYPAVSGWDAILPGGVAMIGYLKNTTAFRSNVGVINLGREAVRVSVGLRDATGAPIGTPVFADLPPGRYWQWDDIFASRYTGAGTRELAYAVVEHVRGNAPVWWYGSVVDNATGDPTTIPVQP